MTYAIQRLQHLLPFNPQKLGPVEALSSFNTAASFTTNTNWQGYVGETTMSYLSQMAGLAWHNFISAAAGIAIAIALARGLTRRGDGKGPGTIGNFWVDLTRATVYILLPICFVVRAGVRLAGDDPEPRALPGGARRSRAPSRRSRWGRWPRRRSIKQLGTNGGGFFNANAAHPFENPNPLTNFFSMFLIFAIPAGLTYTFGRMAKDQRQGWAIFGAMAFLFFAGVTVAYWAEARGNPIVNAQGVRRPVSGTWRARRSASASRTRPSTPRSRPTPRAAPSTPCTTASPRSAAWCRSSTSSSARSSSAAWAPGSTAMLVMAILSVFIAGLMVGRTPEYLGKKIETREVKLAMLYVLVFPLVILAFAAWSAVRALRGLLAQQRRAPRPQRDPLRVHERGRQQRLGLRGPQRQHALVQRLRSASTMLIGRFLMIVPALAVAGILAGKKSVPPGPGTLPTNGPLFAALLVGVILIVGALTFFPALSLGPIVEHFLMQSGKVF